MNTAEQQGGTSVGLMNRPYTTYTDDSWGAGAILIVLASVAAAVSMVLPWFDLAGLTQIGFGIGWWALPVGFVYPCIAAIRGGRLIKVIGIIGGVVVLGFGATVIAAYSQVQLLIVTVNAVGIGAYLFTISTGLLLLGVIMYRSRR